MMLVVDPDSGTPPYAQLRQQLIEAIRTGELPPGSKLPTVRRLAVMSREVVPPGTGEPS